MSKKRGLSLEEKRDKVLEIFHDSKDVFVLKDIEKLAMKKGVTLQSVKDVLQSLVDDNLVHCERIGASNMFWSFPSEAAVQLDTEHARCQQRLAALQQQAAGLEVQVEASGSGRESTAERSALLRRIEELTADLAAKQAKLAAYADNDPERFEALRNGADIARAAANRWLDNLFALKDWAAKRFNGNEKEVDMFFEQCGMTEDMDFLE